MKKFMEKLTKLQNDKRYNEIFEIEKAKRNLGLSQIPSEEEEEGDGEEEGSSY